MIKLVRARARFFGGACLLPAPLPEPGALTEPSLAIAYAAPLDFYAAYHVPFFSTWAVCERAALLAANGDRVGAAELLRSVGERAPNRAWIIETANRYQ